MEDWTKALEKGELIDALYFDFRKAFDSVPHQRLLSKLRACGVTGRAFDWIQAFLTDRQQQVVVRGCDSTWLLVASGIPQGSVLGPTLFLLFINDMPSAVSSSIKMFADDTKIYHPVTLDLDRERLQKDLDAVVAWSDAWQLPFNESKFKILQVGGRNPENNYMIRDGALQKSYLEKDR